MDLKQRLAEKRYGFYVMLAVAVLAIVTAIVYTVSYRNLAIYMSWPAFVLLILGAVIAVALSFIRMDEIGAGVLALFSLIALILFVKVIYEYVAVVLVGIDVQSFDPEFIASTTFFVLTLVASIVAIFLPKNKTKEEK